MKMPIRISISVICEIQPGDNTQKLLSCVVQQGAFHERFSSVCLFWQLLSFCREKKIALQTKINSKFNGKRSGNLYLGQLHPRLIRHPSWQNSIIQIFIQIELNFGVQFCWTFQHPSFSFVSKFTYEGLQTVISFYFFAIFLNSKYIHYQNLLSPLFPAYNKQEEVRGHSQITFALW